MGATGLFSDASADRQRTGAPTQPTQPSSAADQEPQPLMPSGKSHVFDAEIDMCEVDDRDRAGPAWTARAKSISRSSITIRSRRMCYVGALVLVAIHLIDARPVVLHGRVRQCDYDGEGLYRLDIDLLPMPDKPTLRAWMADD